MLFLAILSPSRPHGACRVTLRKPAVDSLHALTEVVTFRDANRASAQILQLTLHLPMARCVRMPKPRMPRRSPMREIVLALSACLAVSAGGVVHAEEAHEGAPAAPAAAPKQPNGWRAEIRQMLSPEGEGYLPASTEGRRRSISREELLRLREDIRANRDVYESRERAGAGRARR